MDGASQREQPACEEITRTCMAELVKQHGFLLGRIQSTPSSAGQQKTGTNDAPERGCDRFVDQEDAKRRVDTGALFEVFEDLEGGRIRAEWPAPVAMLQYQGEAGDSKKADHRADHPDGEEPRSPVDRFLSRGGRIGPSDGRRL